MLTEQAVTCSVTVKWKVRNVPLKIMLFIKHDYGGRTGKILQKGTILRNAEGL